ncbi:MAG: MarR family transcriptional regulator [Cyclobacteriaceae bacterium]
MIAIIDSTEKRRQVERIGVALEKLGLTPVAARILGLLLVAEPPYLTLDEIVEATQASKSSVGNALKFLQSEESIEYITFPGDRKRYFQLSTDTWLEGLQQRVEQLTSFREILLETVDMRSDQHAKFNQSLLDMCDFYGEFEEKVESFISEWKKDRQTK